MPESTEVVHIPLAENMALPVIRQTGNMWFLALQSMCSPKTVKGQGSATTRIDIGR